MTTNSFYRFTPANYNAGFEPAFSPTVDALNGLSVLIPAGYGIGSDVQPMINQLQGYIANLNVESKDFNFRLVYPSPFPVLSGANNLTFYIVNDQLRGANPSQVFTIFWQVTDATIVDAIITPNANVSFTADYSTHLYEPEAVAYRALGIANQNGSAFFPLTYQWNSTTGIASSGLARCNDCQFDLATGYPDRYPGSTLPTSPDWNIEFPALNSEEKYVYLLVEKIINKGFDPSFDYLDLIAYAESLILPSAEWNILTASSTIGFDRIIIEITSSEFSTGFVLVGRYDAKWQFQRFFNYQAGSLFTFLSEYSPSTQLPYEPNNFKAYLTGANTSYDIEQICFEEPCAAEQEYYAMPAKTGDQFQFNIIPESSNMIGITSAKIGLFDCNENFIQQIGIVKQPDCDNESFDIIITNELYEGFSISDGDIIIIGYDCNDLETFTITIPNASLVLSPITEFAQSVIDYINLINTIIASYTIDGSSNITFSLFLNGFYLNTKTINFQLNGISVLDVFVDLDQNLFSQYRIDGPNEGQVYTNTNQIYLYSAVLAEGINTNYNLNYDPLTGIYTNSFDSTFNQKIQLKVQVSRSMDQDSGLATAQWSVDSDGMQDDYRIYVFRSKAPDGTDYVGSGSETFGSNMSFESWFPFDENYIPTDGSVANACLIDGKRFYSIRDNAIPYEGPTINNYYYYFDIETDIILDPPLRIGEELIVYAAAGPINKLWNDLYETTDASQVILPKYLSPFEADGFGIVNNTDLKINSISTGVRCLESTQLQASVEIPAVIDGEYRFALYNQSETALEIYATSNPIRIDNAECFSEIIEFWGDGTVEGFEYYGDWKQRIRIGINGGGEKIQLEESLYRQSNGIHRRPANKTDLSLDLHTDYLDLPAIKAMTSATRHKFLIWKNQNIFVNGDIEVATTQDFTDESSFETLSQMKFQALVQGYQPYNNSCLSC
jgi:hypothetical protein